jgi:16S rRNA processing protein RimM
MTYGPAMLDVGRVTGTHGLRGALKIRPFSGDLSGLLSLRSVRLVLERKGAPPRSGDFTVRFAGGAGAKEAALLLEGISTPEGAAEWRGALVSVPREALPEPEEGEFYVADLVGCLVVDEGGGEVGTVAEVVPGPAHDWLSVRRPGGEEGLLPLVERFVVKVDTAGRRVVVSPPEGW